MIVIQPDSAFVGKTTINFSFHLLASIPSPIRLVFFFIFPALSLNRRCISHESHETAKPVPGLFTSYSIGATVRDIAPAVFGK